MSQLIELSHLPPCVKYKQTWSLHTQHYTEQAEAKSETQNVVASRTGEGACWVLQVVTLHDAPSALVFSSQAIQ